MALPTKTFPQLVADMTTRWITYLTAVMQMNVSTLEPGDPFLALAEAVAGIVMWLQSLINLIYTLTRASTSTGDDLDSFMADFGFTRVPSISASGLVQFSTIAVHSTPVSIPIDTIIQTRGGVIKYKVIADEDQAAWNESLGAYILPPETLSVNVTVEALESGVASNVQAGELVEIVSSVPGVSLVNNEDPVTTGLDAEGDAAFRARFVVWINSRSRAIEASHEAAIQGVGRVSDYKLIENTQANGDELMGFFTAVVDDGSGSPPESLLSDVTIALQATRGFTIGFTVVGPQTVEANIQLNIKVKAGVLQAPVQLAVQTAILDYVNSLKIGEALYLSDIIAVAKGASSDVLAIQPNSANINDEEQDLSPTEFEIIRCEDSDVGVGTY